MDIYDEAIEYLTANPEDIYDLWNNPLDSPAGCLFKLAGPTGYEFCSFDHEYGCLTQIRRNSYKCSFVPELTEKIRADIRIPKDPRDITPDNLYVFAEYQRLLDAERQKLQETTS